MSSVELVTRKSYILIFFSQVGKQKYSLITIHVYHQGPPSAKAMVAMDLILCTLYRPGYGVSSRLCFLLLVFHAMLATDMPLRMLFQK